MLSAMSISTSSGLRGANWGAWLAALGLLAFPFAVLVAGIMAWRGNRGAQAALKRWLVLLGVVIAVLFVIEIGSDILAG